jgi:hypothetical protein
MDRTDATASKNVYVDNGKRGRIFFLSVVLAVSLFIIRALGLIELTNYWHLAGLFAGYFLVAYVGQLWAFRFAVNLRSFLVIVPHSSFFVAAQSLFVMLFFFRDFVRIYEFFLLVALLIVIMVTTYISFLMANVFNVGSFKKIPLEQVAKTASFIITLLYIYFITFSVLSLGVNLFISLILVFVAFLLGSFFHTLHLDYQGKENLSMIMVSTVSMESVLMGAVLLGSNYEVIAILPTTIAFIMFGIEMNKDQLNWLGYLRYFLLFMFAVVLVLFFGSTG